MVDRQQENLHGFWRAQIPSAESIFQELEDSRIVDLDNQVQKPVSVGWKKPKWTPWTESSLQPQRCLWNVISHFFFVIKIDVKVYQKDSRSLWSDT